SRPKGSRSKPLWSATPAATCGCANCISRARPPPSSGMASLLTRRMTASSANSPGIDSSLRFTSTDEGVPLEAMGSFGVLLIPLALGLVSVLLVVTAWLEENVLSPRSLILHTVRTRSRRVLPEHVERLVAAQSERLLRDLER